MENNMLVNVYPISKGMLDERGALTMLYSLAGH